MKITIEIEEVADTELTTDTEAFCRKCGTKIYKRDNFCQRCGSKLEWPNKEMIANTDPMKEKDPNSSLITIIRWFLGILFILSFLTYSLDHANLPAIFLLLISFVLIPPFAEFFENQLKIKMPLKTVIVLLFCFFIINGGYSPHNSNSNLGTSSTASVINAASNNSFSNTATKSGIQTVARWDGKGIKNTETFHISSDTWSIIWDTRPGKYGDMNFQIYLYDSDGHLKDVAANVIGKDTGYTIERGAGDYYLKINTGQPYTVEVDQSTT